MLFRVFIFCAVVSRFFLNNPFKNTPRYFGYCSNDYIASVLGKSETYRLNNNSPSYGGFLASICQKAFCLSVAELYNKEIVQPACLRAFLSILCRKQLLGLRKLKQFSMYYVVYCLFVVERSKMDRDSIGYRELHKRLKKAIKKTYDLRTQRSYKTPSKTT